VSCDRSAPARRRFNTATSRASMANHRRLHGQIEPGEPQRPQPSDGGGDRRRVPLQRRVADGVYQFHGQPGGGRREARDLEPLHPVGDAGVPTRPHRRGSEILAPADRVTPIPDAGGHPDDGLNHRPRRLIRLRGCVARQRPVDQHIDSCAVQARLGVGGDRAQHGERVEQRPARGVQVGGSRDGGRHLVPPTQPPHVHTDRQRLAGAPRQRRQVRVRVGRASRRAASVDATVTSTIVASELPVVGSLVTGDPGRRSGRRTRSR
jgi:hypothetical protein